MPNGLNFRNVLIVLIVLAVGIVCTRYFLKTDNETTPKETITNKVTNKNVVNSNSPVIPEAESLIAPYKFGQEFEGGLRFSSDVKKENGSLIFKLEGRGGENGLFVWLTERDGKIPAMERSKSFNIVCVAENNQGLDAESQKIAADLMLLIVKNDNGGIELAPSSKSANSGSVSFGSICDGVDPEKVKFKRRTVKFRTDNGKTISMNVELADDSVKRCVGLSGRKEIGPDAGMLFIFDGAGRNSFNTVKMLFSIDLIYVDEKGVVSDVVADVPAGSGIVRTPDVDIKYALETNAGNAAALGVKPGAKLVFDAAK